MFSDEDLKRLKTYLTSYDPRTGRKFSRDMKLESLLDRLEAAERALQFMWISDCPVDDSSQEAYRAWRKSAGKEI